MLLFVRDIYSNSKAVFASRPTSGETGCGVRFHVKAAKTDSGDLYGRRMSESLVDSKPICLLAFEETGRGWCDEVWRGSGGATHGQAPRALR